jgi:hypothetical protein
VGEKCDARVGIDGLYEVEHVVPAPRIERRFIHMSDRSGVKRRLQLPHPSHTGILAQFCDIRTVLDRSENIVAG